jgi:hypothetical protein
MCSTLTNQLKKGTISVWYLDDGTVVGEVGEVARAWGIIQQEAARAGLKVNQRKCELVPPRGFVSMKGPGELEDIPLLRGDDFELLGAPLGNKTFCENHVLKRVGKLLTSLGIVDDPQVEMLAVWVSRALSFRYGPRRPMTLRGPCRNMTA